MGACWLGQPAIADIIVEALHYRDGKQYDLISYSIMPNHVHLVATIDDTYIPRRDSPSYVLTDALENLKWYTALTCNTVLERSGKSWHYESYDHVIRDPSELERIVWYVLFNPV